MKLRTGADHYPPKWEVFDNLATTAGPAAFDFACDVGDVKRFAARYRAARSFVRAELDGRTIQTSDGYSVLCHLLLCYSAFEHFVRCIGFEMPQTSRLLDDNERANTLHRLRRLNGQAALFDFLTLGLRPNYQRQVNNHIAAQDCNPFYLAGAMRHAFAHGTLTATPQGVPPETVATVGRIHCRTLVRVRDREFGWRMTEFERMLQADSE